MTPSPPSSFDFLGLIRALGIGAVRCGVACVPSGDLNDALAAFGLARHAHALIELDRARAIGTLERLLARGMAYDLPRLAPEAARHSAEALIAAHESPASRFHSNGDWTGDGDWTPLTPATFDGGLLMSCGGDSYLCVWFEDED